MQATVSSKVYGLILSNPGITLRELNRSLGTSGSGTRAVSSAVHNLIKRGAVKGKKNGARNTQYYKGSAPAVLRQAPGKTQKTLNKEIEVANIIAAIEAGVEVMLAQIKRKLEV
jgi:DNA-binding transcriptional regulator GbsR (MarR family)